MSLHGDLALDRISCTTLRHGTTDASATLIKKSGHSLFQQDKCILEHFLSTFLILHDHISVSKWLRKGYDHKFIMGKVLELEPGSAWAKRCVERLEPLVSERHEKLKNEVRYLDI